MEERPLRVALSSDNDLGFSPWAAVSRPRFSQRKPHETEPVIFFTNLAIASSVASA